METLLLFALLIVLIATSIPIGIALGLATAIMLHFTTNVSLIMIAQKSFSSLDSFPLLAIPFFILAGALMSYGGISRRLVALAESLVGFIIGGLAMVTVLACMFFAAISGSGPCREPSCPSTPDTSLEPGTAGGTASGDFRSSASAGTSAPSGSAGASAASESTGTSDSSRSVVARPSSLSAPC